ncbi:hypothetical protein CPter91_1732 [Collimonas pratensis]|uniref:Uncharacterized protein n=1 Tax=Collimonas pratensis TaxID=279113 RepID=A0A127Q2Q3_9BURK|nr:hypothetical protein CPter91_1732 [Collimonas pratensis]
MRQLKSCRPLKPAALPPPENDFHPPDTPASIAEKMKTFS